MKNILMLILLILLIMTTLGGAFFYFKSKKLSYPQNEHLKTYNKTFSKKEIKNLVINSDVLNILIEENINNQNIEVSAQYNSINQFSVNLENNTLNINQFSVSENKNLNFNGTKEFIKLSLPKHTINKLQIKSAVGNINIKETLFNDLNLKSAVGNIKFTGNEFPNITHIITDVGNVKINIPKPDSYIIKAHASVGSIKVYDNSKMGNFTETFGNENKKIFIDSNVGSIKVY